LLAALTTAASSPTKQASWFQFGTDTYIVLNKTDTALSTDDIVVKLSGTVDLSTMHTSGTALSF